MNIGLSTSVVQRGRTGVGQYVLALLRAFITSGTGHSFFLFVLEKDLPLFEFVRDRMTLITVPESFRPPLANILWHQAMLPQLIRKHGIDLLHIPSYRRMLWQHPCPMVATIHDLAPLRISGKYDWTRTLYARWAVKHLARRQDHIITVSKNTAHDVRHLFAIPESRLSVVYNGVDHARYTPGNRLFAREKISLQYGLKGPFFLYVARLEHPGKNHWRLIRAFEMFHETNPSWRLVFAGSDWTGAAAIHAAISASRCRNFIHSLGFVPDEVVPDIMRAADAFVYPSLYEGFGLPIVEAMACGCPVICSNRNSMLEIAGDAAATVDPENVTALKWQMQQMAESPVIREQHSQAGLRHARVFDWKHTAAAVLSVYESTLAKHRLVRSCDRHGVNEGRFSRAG